MVYVHLADGFEEIEALTVIDLLRRADIPVKSVSIEELLVKGAHDIFVQADMLIDQVDYNDCQMIVLPGGMPGSENLENCKVLSDAIDSFDNSKKYIAAICAAPMILGHKGLLNGKKAVIYDGLEKELGVGVISSSERAVIDGHIITGRGPGCAIEFALKIITVLKGENVADMIKSELLYDLV